MALFAIRRNHPYIGVLTLCKIPGGSFAAKEMVVSEGVFVAAVMAYLDKLSPADAARLKRSRPVSDAITPPSERKAFKVRKAQAAAQ